MEGMLQVDIAAGLQAEQDLLDAVCRGERSAGLLFWQPRDRALVMPRRHSRLPGFAEACAALEAAGWPVLLRETGGEPVPQSPGVLDIALVYAPEPGEGERIELAYRRLCQPLCDWLTEQGEEPSLGEVAGAFCDGRFNVNLQGRKLVGTAQRWRQGQGGTRPVVLAHAALLLENQREEMVTVVNRFQQACAPERQYRADSHISLAETAAAGRYRLERLQVLYEEMLAGVRLA